MTTNPYVASIDKIIKGQWIDSTRWKDPALEAAAQMLKSTTVNINPFIPDIVEKLDEIFNFKMVLPKSPSMIPNFDRWCEMRRILESEPDFEPPDEPYYRVTQFTDSQIRYKTRD